MVKYQQEEIIDLAWITLELYQPFILKFYRPGRALTLHLRSKTEHWQPE